jgi:iron-sulfur cluster repair protein YtfE (RIC family)
MNAIDLLKNDHDYVDMLFGRIEDTPPSRHLAIFKKIKNELDTHAHIEERIFYPTMIKGGDKELQDVTREGLEEHAQIKKFLAGIARTMSKDTREAKLKVLIEDTRHHVKEEENEMFPMVEDQFTSDQLETLGARMEAEKVKFQKAKRIPARRDEPTGKFTKVIEKAMAVVGSMMGTSEEEEKKGTRSDGRGKANNGAATKGANDEAKSKSRGSSSRPTASNGRTSRAASR